MSKRTPPAVKREALLKSIEHWGRIARRVPGETGDAESCALCELFHRGYGARRPCTGCPVKEKTGKPFCQNTPHRAYRNSIDGSPAEAFAAIRMLRFLVSLLTKAA